MAHKKKIITRLKSLSDIDGVEIEISEEKSSFTIRHKADRSLDFYFKWVDNNHWVGYFEDKEGDLSHAVISLWTPMDAVHFATSYSLMINLRAGRPCPL
ncbi:hypothetical protein [Vibrio mediterranei]|uniref:Uncharacterized protein n=1 Tax=Vibrio mediterranei TaxID=689 RepID=A0A3G4VJT8_9VIBR|nr:hypothetical protein [Vibrio mediterranei]AYV24469.1 hypothetical protein ECB94_24765 [Vibrio mediterranei]